MTTVHEGIEIYCFAEDQVKRNKWVAVFRRMGIVVQGAKKSSHAHSSGTCPHDQALCPSKFNNNNDAMEGSNKPRHCIDGIALQCSDEDETMKYLSTGSESIAIRLASRRHGSLGRKQQARTKSSQGLSC
jgi:hypothetical protein